MYGERPWKVDRGVSRYQVDSALECGDNGGHALRMKGSSNWPVWRYKNTIIYDELTKCQVVRCRRTRSLGVQLSSYKMKLVPIYMYESITWWQGGLSRHADAFAQQDAHATWWPGLLPRGARRGARRSSAEVWFPLARLHEFGDTFLKNSIILEILSWLFCDN